MDCFHEIHTRVRNRANVLLYREYIHSWPPQCPFKSPGDCLPHCKHWRSNALRACKGLGWQVPNVVAFFREALLYCSGIPIFYPERFLGGYLKPNAQHARLESSDAQTLSMVTRYTADEDYQTTLDQVADMFTRLPVDWGSKYEQEMASGSSAPWNGFTDVIEKIKRELGIDVSDVSPQDEDDA